MTRYLLVVLAFVVAATHAATAVCDDKAPTSDAENKVKEPPRKLYSGKVVLAQEALKRRGIKVAEEMKDHAVLETLDGDIVPIAADWRGRALYQDKRLRGKRVDLVGYQRKGIPYLQVLVIHFIGKDGKREEMDYWCDICSIPMYEIKECECCQGPIRLRFRPAKLPSYLNDSASSDKP